jgi:GT2 family glycosyltransferase
MSITPEILYPDSIPLAAAKVGAVVIGRNEGERLERCLASMQAIMERSVYVDSGSSDGSVALAQAMKAEVVSLDMRSAFAAARARNEGFRRLLSLHPMVDFVQFVDGDCEVVPGWLESARAYLEDHPDCAVVCGRRRERYPERSIYNRMCDVEWNTPVGDALSCGGDAMMRAKALAQVGGYRDSLIAGEEPELCLRLRRAGWRVHRLDREMTLHDAAITRFSQWWRRTVRAGHAFAEGAWLHGRSPERHWVRETVRAVAWGLLLPVAIAALALLFDPRAGLLLVIYPLQWLRLALRKRSPRDAFFQLVSKFAETQGVVKFWLTKLQGRTAQLIEYK